MTPSPLSIQPLRRPLAAGLAVLGGTLLGGGLLSPAARGQIVPTGGSLTLGTQVSEGGPGGTTTITGGTRRGDDNLFHRLNRFDTRTGIRDVLIQNQNRGAVVMGVIGRERTHITVPVNLQTRAGLILMSPAGISVSGDGQFRNVSRLGLTNQTDLNVGGRWFNALSTTAGDLNKAAFASPINFERASLRTDGNTLRAIGLSSPGSIDISSTPGVELVVDSNLLSGPLSDVLIDSSQAALTIDNTTLTSSADGSPSFSLYGADINVAGSSLDAGPSGLVNAQADRTLTLSNSTLQGLKIGLKGNTIVLIGDIPDIQSPDVYSNVLSAARGLIKLEANNRISVENSKLVVAPGSKAGLLSSGLSLKFEDPDLGTVLVPSPPLIQLSTTNPTGSIEISNSNFDASSIVKSIPDVTPDDWAGLIRNAGNIFIRSSGALEISASNFFADADTDLAGLISLIAIDPLASLKFIDSNIKATSPNGSGDASLFSEGPIEISGSRLETITNGFGSDGYSYSTPPEIRITSRSAGGISIDGSTLIGSMNDMFADTSQPSLFAEPFSESVDYADNFTYTFDAPPSGGLIRLTSEGPISVANSTLDTSSNSGIAGIIEIYSNGLGGVTLENTTVEATNKDSQFYLNVHPGQIDVVASNGIAVIDSRLDVGSFITKQMGFNPLSAGNINLLSGSGEGAAINLNTTSPSPLNASASLGPGGNIRLAAETGEVSLTAPAGNIFNISGDPSGTFTVEENSIDIISSYQSTVGAFGDDPSYPWKLTYDQIYEAESGDLGLGEKPFSLSQFNLVNQYLQSEIRVLVVINRDPTKTRVVVLDQSLDTTVPLAKQTQGTFDTTTQDGLASLSSFLRSQGISEEAIASTLQNVGNRAATSAGLTGTSTASDEESSVVFSAALANQGSLSEAQSAASLQNGEEASRGRLAEFLGNSTQAPPVPTLSALQEMLRQAGTNSSGGTADQAAILRISYAADPQASSAGAGSLDLVLITADGQPSGWRTTIQLAEFRDLLRRYYSDLAEQNLAMNASTPAEDAPERRLFELVFGKPMEQLERARIGTLIISADPALIDIPFNALHDGKRYLSQRFSLAITPSLAYTNLTAPAVGHTASSGQRINAGASLFRNGLTPLPMVEKELAELSLPQSKGQVTTLLNSQFNPSSFSSGFAAAGTRQVHIASHAEIAAGPQRIPTIYTGDTALSLRELGQLRQRSGASNLDLVTLSACRSALNGADLELGFAGLAVQLGAKTAIGTKWYVDDLATSSFFVLFYRQLQQGLAKADALRATQQAFASGQVRVEGTSVIGPGNGVLLAQLPESYQHRYTRGFSHPYYWAGVQLVGSPW